MLCGCVGCLELSRVWIDVLYEVERAQYETPVNFREEQIRLGDSSFSCTGIQVVSSKDIETISNDEIHERALERWADYEESLYKSRGMSSTLSEENLPICGPDVSENVFIYKEQILRFRSNYMLLVNALGELFEIDPLQLSAQELAHRVAKEMFNRTNKNTDGTGH